MSRMVIFHDEDYYRSRVPKPNLGPVGNVMRFLWNKEQRAFLGRTTREWGQLGIFYFTFFTVVGSIFIVQMKISIDYVSQLKKPFFQYPNISPRSSVVKRFAIFSSPWQFDNPGIVFKPNSVSAASPIISINDASVNTKPTRYIQALTDFLQEYNRNTSNYNLNCGDKNDGWNDLEKPCFFDVTSLGTCSESPYGYTEPMQPCILIKFNKRFDWVPECYNRSSHLPEDMPSDLKRMVQYSDKLHVWLSCDGVNNVDKEHMGEIEYIPRPGFSIDYFPFTGQPYYLSPIVALQFKNLTPNRLVTIECTLWAVNIQQRARKALDFQIIIELIVEISCVAVTRSWLVLTPVPKIKGGSLKSLNPTSRR